MRYSWWLPVLWFVAAPAGVAAQEPEPRPIDLMFECLDRESFTPDTLGRIFLAARTRPANNEIWLQVHGACYDLDQLEENAPAAFFFRIDDSCFYLLDDGEGGVDWHVLDGSNLFMGVHDWWEPGRTGLSRVHFAFQRFVLGEGPTWGSTRVARRELGFVVENLERLGILEIKPLIRYFDELLPQPTDTTIIFGSDLRNACTHLRGALAPRLGMCWKEDWTADPPASGIQIFYKRWLSGGRSLSAYVDGTRAHEEGGPLPSDAVEW